MTRPPEIWKERNPNTMISHSILLSSPLVLHPKAIIAEWTDEFKSKVTQDILSIIRSSPYERGHENNYRDVLVRLINERFGALAAISEMPLFIPMPPPTYYTLAGRVDIDAMNIGIEIKIAREVDDIQILIGQVLRNRIVYGSHRIAVIINKVYPEKLIDMYAAIIEQTGCLVLLQ